MNFKKDVLKPVLITFAALILLLGLVMLSLHLWCPYAMAQISYKLGANNAALSYFEKDYKNSKNYDVLYSILNLSIKTDNNEKLVSYFEEFSVNENYRDYIKKIDEKNLSLKVTNLVKSKLYSEDNYLKNRYVLALAKLSRTKDAFNYAFDNTSFVADENKLDSYLFTYISNVNYFENCENSNNATLKMCEYFNNLFSVFKATYVNDEKTVLNFAVGGRINEVGNNIKELDKLGYSVTLSAEQINDVILQVNQKMALKY